jgi:hypothetical protein
MREKEIQLNKIIVGLVDLKKTEFKNEAIKLHRQGYILKEYIRDINGILAKDFWQKREEEKIDFLKVVGALLNKSRY